jgi:hypothetical protein
VSQIAAAETRSSNIMLMLGTLALVAIFVGVAAI